MVKGRAALTAELQAARTEMRVTKRALENAFPNIAQALPTSVDDARQLAKHLLLWADLLSKQEKAMTALYVHDRTKEPAR